MYLEGKVRESIYFLLGVFQHHALGLFSSMVNPCCIGPGRMSVISGKFIRQNRPGTFSASMWGTCAKPEVWMLAQELDSMCPPFSNEFSKMDILQNSKHWKAFGDIRTNTWPLANEAVSIYNFNWLDWKGINLGWHTWTSVKSNLSSTALKETLMLNLIYF